MAASQPRLTWEWHRPGERRRNGTLQILIERKTTIKFRVAVPLPRASQPQQGGGCTDLGGAAVRSSRDPVGCEGSMYLMASSGWLQLPTCPTPPPRPGPQTQGLTTFRNRARGWRSAWERGTANFLYFWCNPGMRAHVTPRVACSSHSSFLLVSCASRHCRVG